ncbi:MAG: efflux RND transporter permease subunit, partial [Planctomycetota bacterium]|nr:efflux RND transporter permease subunit [Planctomycetota bacterium]
MTSQASFRFLVRRPVGLLVSFLTLVVIGVLAYSRIPLQLLPDGFTDDSVMIWVPNPGASARENEEKVARVVEAELRTLQGVERITSTSQESVVQLRVSFNATVDMELAKAEIRDRLERARPELPDTAEQIGMWSESGGSLPLAFFSVTHLGDGAETDYLIDEIGVPRLTAAEGVSNIQIWGALQDTVRIALNEDRVIAQNVDVMALIGGLSSDNFSQPLGEVTDGGGRLILRSDMRFDDPAEIERYPIGNGMTIGDIGEVRRSKSVRDQITRVDGNYAYFGIAQKESQANVVEASRNFKAAIEELRNDPAVAGKLDFVPFFVQGDMIQASLDQLIKTALQGGFFAAIVLLLFLRRIRTTLCVALAIPFSTLLALAFEYATGGSFNVLTMVGITLAIGMLVDNAVVVVENIVRLRPTSKDDLDAAARGTAEIALPVTLATLTTVVVFLPIIFMSENPMVRLMLGGMGIPLCASLLASLFVAVVFLPVVIGRVVGDRHPLVERIARPVGLVMRIPARLLAHAIGAVRFGFHATMTVAWHVERLFLFGLAPLRFLLAPLAIAAGAWSQIQAAPEAGFQSLVAGRLREGAGQSPDFVGPRLFLGLLVALFLLFVLPGWRRRFARSAAPARAPQLVPGGHSLIDWLVSSNRRLVSWTLDHRLRATVVSCLALFSIVVPASQLVKSAFTQGDGGNSIDFGVTFDANFTLG